MNRKLAAMTAFGEDYYEEDWKDRIPGGKADKKSPADFDPEQLDAGVKVEREHTDDRHKALEIAMDHLTEDPDYYKKLKRVEKTAMLRPRALAGFASELTKIAIVTKALRGIGRLVATPVAKATKILSTPIPGTPKIFMKVRNADELKDLEKNVRQSIKDKGLLYTGLKGAGIDKLWQGVEPVFGSTTSPAEYRKTFGDRKIWEWANRPFQTIMGYLPIPYGGAIASGVGALAQKLRLIDAPRPYPMPGGASKITDAAKEVAKSSTAAKPGKKRFRDIAEMAGVASIPSAAVLAGEYSPSEKNAMEMEQPAMGTGRGLKKRKLRKIAQSPEEIQQVLSDMLEQAQYHSDNQQPFWADQGSTDQSAVSDTFYGHGKGLRKKAQRDPYGPQPGAESSWADQGGTIQSAVSDTFYGHGKGLKTKRCIQKTANLFFGRPSYVL